MENVLSTIELYSKEINAFVATDADALEQFRIKFLGVKGIVKSLMGEMQHVPVDQKKSFGQTMNAFKQLAESLSEHGVGDFDSEKSLGVVMRCRIFTTKAGNLMASMYMYDPIKNRVYKIVIFNRTLNSVIHLVRHQFAPLIYRKSVKSSDIIFEDAISLEKFREIKGITS